MIRIGKFVCAFCVAETERFERGTFGRHHVLTGAGECDSVLDVLWKELDVVAVCRVEKARERARE